MSVYAAKPTPPRSGRNLRGRPRACAFYDLDGTLASLNLLHATAFYLAERDDRRLLNMKLFEAYKGVSRDRLWELGDEYCERVLVRHLYPRAIEMLEGNRAAGIEPVLVTGSDR